MAISKEYMADNQRVIVTGARGTGKSTLLATYLPPSQIHRAYVHDSEKSMNNIRKNMIKRNVDFGRYVDLEDRFGDLPSDDDLLSLINKGKLPWVDKKAKSGLVKYYEFIIEDLDKNLTNGEYDVYIMDTLEKLESGMVARADENKKIVGVSRGLNAPYGEFWWGALYPLYSQLFSAIFARGVKAVLMSSHLKTPWHDKKPIPGKVAPSGKSLLYKISSLMLWLVNEPNNMDGAPAGLVLKERLGQLEINRETDEWEPRRMLPRRIPHCTWNDIHRYLVEGCDLSSPAEGEMMSESEKEMISELLTNEQMRLMILAEEKELEEIKQQSGVLVSSTGETFDPMKQKPKENQDVNGGTEMNADQLDQLDQMIRDGISTKEIKEKLEVPFPTILKRRKVLK
jgi:hypothetical protein